MANIIDTLVVELAHDQTKLTQAQRQAVAAAKQLQEELLKHGKEQEAAGARIANFFENAKRELLGVMGIMLGGRTLAHFVEMNASIERNARTIGVSTEQLAKWGAMARLTGGDINSVTASMQGLADQIGMAQLTGNWGSLLQITSRLGINLKTTKDGLVDIDALLDDLNKTFQKMDPVSARTIGAMLGLDPSTINLLMLQRSEFERTRNSVAEMAKGLDEAAQRSSGLYKSFQLLRAEGDLWIAKIIAQWSPQFTAFLDKIRELLHLTSVDPESGAAGDIVRSDRAMMEKFMGKSPWQDPEGGLPLNLVPGGEPMLPRHPIFRGRQAKPTASVPDWLPFPSDLATGGAIPPALAKSYGAALAGASAPSGGTTNNSTSSTHIGTVNVNINGAASPEETGRSVQRVFQRFQNGAATYNGPH